MLIGSRAVKRKNELLNKVFVQKYKRGPVRGGKPLLYR